MRYLIPTVAFSVLLFISKPGYSLECNQCSQIEAGGSRSCSSIQEADRYNYCMKQVTDAAGRCWKVCTNYNGVGPAPRGSTLR
jgi:hypothetical protein